MRGPKLWRPAGRRTANRNLEVNQCGFLWSAEGNLNARALSCEFAELRIHVRAFRVTFVQSVSRDSKAYKTAYGNDDACRN